MRRRLLLSTLAVLAVALLLLGLPLAVAVEALLTRRALDELQRLAEQVQVLIEQEASLAFGASQLMFAISEETGARLILFDRSGPVRTFINTGGPPADAQLADVDADVRAALSGQVGAVAENGVLAVTVPVRGGPGERLLRAARADDDLRTEVRRAWTAMAVVALAALATGAAVASWQAKRLARPLVELAASAERLGKGDFSARAPRSGIEDLDAVAVALDVTAARLAEALARGRSFRADASHQLRTPLTALRLDLEALDYSGPDPQVLAAALSEVDRLEATIGELEQLAEPQVTDERVDLGALIAQRLDAWQSLARAQGRTVELRAAPVAPVQARPAALGQSLQVLLDNALEHGSGAITVSIEPTSGGVRVCVADEGDGMPEHVPQGRGLWLAESLVAAEGGRLSIERPPSGTKVCLL
ncbi:MAG TPA: HAMP domain-containing sensor histidine kinase, partial [Egibacteraceae bacterium]|nr:HAMP domain-containing sensor histidine kinase [Egibacteraceae bacterium]